jgi:hypothetical protein
MTAVCALSFSRATFTSGALCCSAFGKMRNTYL